MLDELEKKEEEKNVGENGCDCHNSLDFGLRGCLAMTEEEKSSCNDKKI
ncbi:MAG TPA: hypothetical protein PLT58_08095 [Atribacterota bacterium]|nr:hypothetical protein [Atribacterota bacterium]HOR41917.1 hypothetical protein [Atribacterota bacterium]